MPLERGLFGIRVGFAIIWVTVTGPPSVSVEVNVEVIAGGAVEVGEPRLSVVLMNMIDGNVVLHEENDILNDIDKCTLFPGKTYVGVVRWVDEGAGGGGEVVGGSKEVDEDSVVSGG